MDCKAAKRKVDAYIRNELSDNETEEFLEHVKECDSCREELEIYYTIEVGLKKLDSGSTDYNITGALESAIRSSYQRLHRIRVGKIVKYSVNTLVVMSVIGTLLLQLRILITAGLL